MGTLDQYPPLTEVEEAVLIARLPDEAAAESLVMGSMQPAIKYLSKVSRGSVSEQELVSLCYLALSKAVKRVQPGKGGFFRYSKIWLRGSLFAAWKTQGRVVRRGDMIELAQLERIDDDSERVETTEHPSTGFDFRDIECRESGALAEQVIKRVCSDHERIILDLRFKLDYSYAQIAGFMGTTRSASQSSCERALRKLRVAMTADGTLRK